MTDKELKRNIKKYIKVVNSLIICDAATRKKYKNDLKNRLCEYIEDNPVSSMEDIYNGFGMPKDIAREFLLHADIVKIKRKMNITKVITIGVIIALAMFMSFLVIEFIDAHPSNHGYGIETIRDPVDYDSLPEDERPDCIIESD